MSATMKDNFILLGKMAGAFMALISLCVFFGEPFLEDYVQDRIRAREEYLSKKKKESFRVLLGKALKVDADEVTFILRDVVNDSKKVKKEVIYYHPTTVLNK
jgi:hypothetical protein